jgi:hypothetical protein
LYDLFENYFIVLLLLFLESFSRWPDIHDQPADSIYVEQDFNQTVPRKSSF